MTTAVLRKVVVLNIFKIHTKVLLLHIARMLDIEFIQDWDRA